MFPKNTTEARALAMNQSIGDRTPIFRVASGEWFGIIRNSQGNEEVVPLCVCDTEPPTDGNIEAPTIDPTAYVGTETGLPAIPDAGTIIELRNRTTNTGIVTLDLDGTGVLPVQKPNGEALVSGDIKANETVVLIVGAAQAFYIFAGIKNADGTINAEIEITRTQILALNSAPVPIIPNFLSTGLGTVVVLQSLTALNNFATIAYIGAGTPTLQYIASNNDTHIDLSNVWLTAAAITFEAPDGDGFAAIPIAGEGIEFTVTVGDPTTGNGSYIFQYTYRIHQF